MIHHNEAENEEFVFYDDDKRCGARGRTVVTLQPPGERGPRDTIGCQPLQMLMLILARARLLPTLSFIKYRTRLLTLVNNEFVLRLLCVFCSS